MTEPQLVKKALPTALSQDGRWLVLIDAPEAGQGSSSLRARRALKQQLAPADSALVEIDVGERDRYGRVLAHLYSMDGAWVNRALVRDGYAVPLVYPPNVRYVEVTRAVADSARVEGRGLWQAGPLTGLPADFRAGRCGSHP